MTDIQARSFRNITFDEKDYYKGERILLNFEQVNYQFALLVDSMATYAKYISAEKVQFLVHDFNNYVHSSKSAHYGDPEIEERMRECVACDYRLKGVNPIDQVRIALLYPFRGIFFYPYSKTFFIHVDIKWWDRPQDTRTTLGFKDKDGQFITTTNYYIKVMQMIETLEDMEFKNV